VGVSGGESCYRHLYLYDYFVVLSQATAPTAYRYQDYIILSPSLYLLHHNIMYSTQSILRILSRNCTTGTFRHQVTTTSLSLSLLSSSSTVVTHSQVQCGGRRRTMSSAASASNLKRSADNVSIPVQFGKDIDEFPVGFKASGVACGIKKLAGNYLALTQLPFQSSLLTPHSLLLTPYCSLLTPRSSLKLLYYRCQGCCHYRFSKAMFRYIIPCQILTLFLFFVAPSHPITASPGCSPCTLHFLNCAMYSCCCLHKKRISGCSNPSVS
jgi:hypothetical protein